MPSWWPGRCANVSGEPEYPNRCYNLCPVPGHRPNMLYLANIVDQFIHSRSVYLNESVRLLPFSHHIPTQVLCTASSRACTREPDLHLQFSNSSETGYMDPENECLKFTAMPRRETQRTLRRTLAQNVRLIRTIRGWSQETLAEKAGMKRSSLARIESGGSIPTIATLSKLAKAFGKQLEVHFV